MYAKVRIKVREADQALLVPQRCLIELQGKFSVLAVGADNKVVSKPVQIFERVGDMAIVSEGIEKDDMVVIDALQKARPGAEVVPQVTEFESKTIK